MKIYSALTLPFLSKILVGAWKDLSRKEQGIWEQIENKIRDLMNDTFKKFSDITPRSEPYPVIPCFCTLLKNFKIKLKILNSFFSSFGFTKDRIHS